jgi:penicillin-binding protein 2
MDYRQRWELKDYLIGRRLERRILLFHVALFLLTLGFVLNFWYLQGVQGERYARLAETNRLRRIPTPPMRGVIYDRRGSVISATRPSLNLVLLREGLADGGPQLRRLAPILGTTYDALLHQLDRLRDRPQFEPLVLKEDVTLEELSWIEARRELFPAVEVQQTTRRSYPHGDLFAHVLGYVGEVSESQLGGGGGELQLGDIVGQSGVERAYDERLRGRRGWNMVTVNNLGRRMGAALVGSEPLHGDPLTLTLDLGMQRALREGLGEETGAGVFLDPATGEVLALVSTPAFDPNRFADGIGRDDWKAITADPRRPLHDRVVSSFYAPGSTFKVLMAIAGLESGTIGPGESVFCTGSTRIHGHVRLCWKRGGHGTVNLRRALAESCNVYFYHLGQRLGIDPIHEYGDRFNLGRLTDIDLPNEAPGVLPSQRWKRERMHEPWSTRSRSPSVRGCSRSRRSRWRP